jgi:hypothetical protein
MLCLFFQNLPIKRAIPTGNGKRVKQDKGLLQQNKIMSSVMVLDQYPTIGTFLTQITVVVAGHNL